MATHVAEGRCERKGRYGGFALLARVNRAEGGQGNF